MNKIYLFILFFIAFTGKLYSQNIVPNGDFEQYDSCPDSRSQLNRLLYWTSPNTASPDYFNSCSTNPAISVPTNFAGHEKAHSGNGYVGIYLFKKDSYTDRVRNYLQIHLKQTLRAGEIYNFQMWVSLSDHSLYASSSLGVYFSNNNIQSNDSFNMNYSPQIAIVPYTFLKIKNGWTIISGKYVANGGENYITIGKFSPNYADNIACCLIDSNNRHDDAYYYIDDVYLSVCNINDSNIKMLPNDTSLCIYQFPFILTANLNNKFNTTTYIWNTGEITKKNIIVKSAGKYWIAAYNQNECVISDTINISILETPSVYLGNDTNFCNSYFPYLLYPEIKTTNTIKQYLWNTGDNTSGILIYSTGKYWLTIFNTFGCKNSDTINISKTDLPQINIGNDTVLCDIKNFILYPQTNDNMKFLWNTGETISKINIDTSGIYWLNITDTSGCQNSDTINITFLEKPILFLGNDTTLCFGDILCLYDKHHYKNYLWNNGSSDSFLYVKTGGIYWIKVNNNGCFSQDTIVVNYYDSIYINLPSIIKTCDPDLILNLQNFKSYLWQDGSTNNFYHITTFGRYKIEVLDNNNCEEEKEINVINICPAVYVPNAFTPDKNSINDAFYPVTRNLKMFNIKIYSRWGELIFESDDINIGWDGKYNNLDCPADTYFYYITYIGSDNITNSIKGNVTLLR